MNNARLVRRFKDKYKVAAKAKLSTSDRIGLAGIFISALLSIIAVIQAYTNAQQDISIRNFAELLKNTQQQIKQLTELNALQSKALNSIDSNLFITRDIQSENVSRTKFETSKEKADLMVIFREIDFNHYTLLDLLVSWRSDAERESLVREIEEFRTILEKGLANRYLLANEPLAKIWEKLHRDLYIHSLALESLAKPASLQADNVDVPQYESSLKEDLKRDSKTFKKLFVATRDYIVPGQTK